jgi:hypothetical protein
MEQMMERLMAIIRTNIERLKAKMEANNGKYEVLQENMRTSQEKNENPNMCFRLPCGCMARRNEELPRRDGDQDRDRP